MDGTLTISIHDFDGIKRILGLPIDSLSGRLRQRPILEALNDLPAAQAAQLHQQLDALELDIAHRATAQVGARELLTKLRPPWWRASRSRGERTRHPDSQ
jgi:hypothetical protein